MRLSNIKAQDIVRVNIGGRFFFAEVAGKEERKLNIVPINPNINFYSAKASEVVGHWLRAKGNS